MFAWLGWVFIVIGVGFIVLEVAFSHLGPYIRINIQRKKLAKAKARLVDAKLTEGKPVSDKVVAAREDEVKKAEADVAAAEAGVIDIINGLIAKFPWVVIVGFILIYFGLCLIGAPLPVKIRVG